MTYTLLHVEIFLWSWSINGYCFTALIVHLRGYIKRRPKSPGNIKKSSLAGVRPLKFDRGRQATWLYWIGYLGLTKKDLQIDDCGLSDVFWASFRFLQAVKMVFSSFFGGENNYYILPRQFWHQYHTFWHWYQKYSNLHLFLGKKHTKITGSIFKTIGEV